MLDQFFEEPRALERARGSAAGPYLEGFSDWLRKSGYAPSSVLKFVRTAVHVGLWAARSHTAIRELDQAAIERFRGHLRTCSCPGPRPRRRRDRRTAALAARFLQYLRVEEVAREEATSSARQVHPLVAGFGAWMRRHRGATTTTLRIYGRIVTDALGALGDDPSAFDARGLRDFVLERSRTHGRSKAKQVMTAMRAWLRHLVASGACAPLEGAIPTIAFWRMASLPRYLSSADIDRVIMTCDPSTASGTRNRAILLLLARLGLRAGDVAALCLQDLNWRQATVAVSGKSRRGSRLPLPQEVGDAILAYLPRRPIKTSEHVFLRMGPPWGPIAPGTVTSVVTRAIRIAGVVALARGAHLLRHSAASELLRQGASLDQVRIVLRHQDPETTRLYAKVDLVLLRRVAQPWPKVAPC
jgi:integrase/recombinase XerD